MYSHLVAVEVCVECSTYQGMQLYCTALNQYGLKCLDTQSVECRRTVQEHGVILDDYFQCIPYVVLCTFHALLCGTDIGGLAYVHKSLHYEGLEQLESHFLGQTALIHLQLGAYHDNGTSGVVNTLTQKVLSETSLLTLEHIGKGLEGTVVGACYGSAEAAVVDKGIDSLLQHSLLVSHDDVGGFKLQHLLESVISVDDTSVQVIEVGGGISAAVQHYHRTQVGGYYRHDGQHHPLGLVV